jgi:hypothetical protein
MDRTAEEFVHQLPSGRWFVGDVVTTRNGQDVFLVETVRGRSVAELTMDAIVAAGIPTYASQVEREAGRNRCSASSRHRVPRRSAGGPRRAC